MTGEVLPGIVGVLASGDAAVKWPTIARPARAAVLVEIAQDGTTRVRWAS